MKLRTLLLALISVWTLAVWPSANAQAEGPVMFSFGGFSYSTDDLPLHLQHRLYEIDRERYAKRLEVIDQALIEFYIEAQANIQKKTQDQVRAELLPIQPITDTQVRLFYDQNKARIPAPFDKVRAEIEGFLRQQQEQAQHQGLLAKIKRETEFELLTKAPDAPIYDIDTSGYPSKGNPEAKVTLVEFADYQCPHCRKAHVALKKHLRQFGDQVRLVFMDFPINRSGISRRVAEGAVCAAKQNKYWEYNDAAFERQNMLNANSPFELAKAVYLDMDKFGRCYDSAEVRARVAYAKDLGRSIGVDSTPTFFLNGKRLRLTDFNQELADEIATAIRRAR